MKKFFIIVMAGVLITFASCGCHKEDSEPPPPPPEPDPIEEPAAEYSINGEVFDYLGKMPGEIDNLLGEFEESTWLSGMIFKYGDFWFSFDGDTEYPYGALSLIACPAVNLIENLDDEADVSALDELFGVQGVYEANENGGNEWYAGGYVRYEYNDCNVSLGCNPDMSVDKETLALITAVSHGGEYAVLLAGIIDSPFDCVWEELESDEWYGHTYRNLVFRDNGEVEYHTGFQFEGEGGPDDYEIYNGTYQVFLAEEGSDDDDIIVLDLTLSWWISELGEGSEEEDYAYWEERMEVKGSYRIWTADGALHLQLQDGKSMSTTGWRGEPIEDFTFRKAPE